MPEHHPKQMKREEINHVSKNRKEEIREKKKAQSELDKERHRLELAALQEMDKDDVKDYEPQ
jgi:hypothetical protein